MYRMYVSEQAEQVSEAFIWQALPCLPVERREKALRFRLLVDRNNCVISYLLLKRALREVFHIENFTLRYGKYGKPCLVEYENVHFNISHCRWGCVVAVADYPVGVDIEETRPFSWDIAERVCHKRELEELEASNDRELLFTKIWTMKESYFKWTGEGIGEGMKEIDILRETGFVMVEEKDYVIALCGGGKIKEEICIMVINPCMGNV